MAEGFCEICRQVFVIQARQPKLLACQECKRSHVYPAALLGLNLIKEAKKNAPLLVAMSPDGRHIYWATPQGINSVSSPVSLINDMQAVGFNVLPAWSW